MSDLPDPGAETRRFAPGASATRPFATGPTTDLLRLAAAVQSSLHLDEVVARLLDQIGRVFTPGRLVLLLADDRGRLAVRAERGAAGPPPPREALRDVADRRAPVRTSSALTVPLLRDDRLIGALHLERPGYDDEDVRTMEVAAAFAAQALDHARTHERELLFGRRLARMSEAARRLAILSSEEEVAVASVEEAGRLFDCTKASLLVFDPAAGVLRVGASNCVDPALWPSIAVRPGDGPAGRVFQDARPAVVDVVAPPTPGRRYSTESFAIAPVVARPGSQPLGVLTVTDKTSKEPFSARDEGALAMFAAHVAVALEAARFVDRTTADALTRLPARTFFDARLEEEVKAARGPLALIVADVDHLKDKNEIYGPETGDRLLRELAGLLRAYGAPARLGEDAFALLAPGLDLGDATSRAKDLRLAVERFDFNADREPLHATVSVGLALLKPGETAEAFLKRAEQAVYMAKKNGRNRVESAR
jgi:diguanylate cyclase (GGDEF)-like protein